MIVGATFRAKLLTIDPTLESCIRDLKSTRSFANCIEFLCSEMLVLRVGFYPLAQWNFLIFDCDLGAWWIVERRKLTRWGAIAFSDPLPCVPTHLGITLLGSDYTRSIWRRKWHAM
jgi:hypothetical protein